MRQWQSSKGGSEMKNEKVWRHFLKLIHLFTLAADVFGPIYSPATAGLSCMIFNYKCASQIMTQKMDSFPVKQVQNLAVHLISLYFKPTATNSTVDLNVTTPWTLTVYFFTVMSHFVCQLDWTIVCPDIWSHIILVCLRRYFGWDYHLNQSTWVK